MGLFSYRKRSSSSTMSISSLSSSGVGSSDGAAWSPRLQSQINVQGQRHANEDRVLCGEAFVGSNGEEITVFAVADGHGGSACAQFVVDNLAGAMQRSAAWDNATKYSPLRERLAQAVVDALEALELAWMEGAVRSKDTSGACLVLAVHCESYVVVANVGDCQALMVLPGATAKADSTVIALSKPHRASDASEMMRIISTGAYVVNGRVCGGLEPSRTIGDFDVKSYAPGAVTAEPHVTEIDLAELCGAYVPSAAPVHPLAIVLASDGVWDVVSREKAALTVSTALAAEARGRKNASAAQELVRAALKAGTLDDAAAIVALFERVGAYQAATS